MPNIVYIHKVTLFLFLAFSCIGAHAQAENPIVLKIEGKPIYKSEVERAFKKSNSLSESGVQTIDDFINGFIKLKLNVAEAKALKLDTASSFLRDYSSYKIQLSKTFLEKKDIENEVVELLYKRLQENVELNHILLPFTKNQVFPSDTLFLYNKAIKLREQLLKNGFKGEGFIDNTKNRSIVHDPDSLNGYLGWVMAFTLQPVVEDAAYTLPLNEISMPIRSERGYHLLQVLNRRPSVGLVDVEQINFQFTELPPSKHQIDSVGKAVQKIYDKLIVSNDFENLCSEYNKVMGNDRNDCNFGVVGLNSELPPSFINAAFAIKKVGDFSKPVITDYGYHIIRLKEKIAEPTLEEIRTNLINNILNGSRAIYYSKAWISRMGSEYNLEIDQKSYNKINMFANDLDPCDIGFQKLIENDEDILFTIDNSTQYTVSQFMKYLSSYSNNTKLQGENSALNKSNLTTDKLKIIFDNYVSSCLSEYAESTLEAKNPDFAYVMNEYVEGILYFDVMNENVWKRADKDKPGLEAYFKKNKKKFIFESPRFKGLVIFGKNEDVLKKTEYLLKAQRNIPDIVNTINNDSTNITIDAGCWKKGENPFVDHKIFGGAQPKLSKSYPFFAVEGKLITKPETIEDVPGLIFDKYQEELEKNWFLNLRKKYKVEIDKSVLKSIK